MKVRDALAELEAKGLDALVADDLEVYRLVMTPASFKALERRLSIAVQAFWADKHRATWDQPALPFGVDLEVEARVERWKRGHVEGPNGERFPATWTIEPEADLPGRLKLVRGREFTATGIRGRLRFRHAVRTDYGQYWIEAWDTNGGFRAIRPERVRIVHRTSKVRSLRERLR